MRLIDEIEYQEKLARVPMELRTYRKAVEVALDMSTVKAIPIERLEQIRAEIDSRLQGVNITLKILVKDDALIPRMEAAKTTLEEVLEIIDEAIKEQNE